MKSTFIFIFTILTFTSIAQEVRMFIHVRDTFGNGIQGAELRLQGSPFSAKTDNSGLALLMLPKRKIYTIIATREGFKGQVKGIRGERDSINVVFTLAQLMRALDTVAVVAVHKPETLVSSPNTSVFDFDFYGEGFLLLKSARSLDRARVVYNDQFGKEVHSVDVPRNAGRALYFHHDYEGYTDLVCSDSVFRIDVWYDRIVMLPVAKNEFEKYVLPIKDTMGGKYYYSDQWDKYPAFNYYAVKRHDTLSNLLCSIRNEDLIRFYNLEYYYLPSGMQLEARRLADRYKTDEHIAAALLSGFTGSKYYEPLFAPLFIINDTICIFNHYKDLLFHYTKQNVLVDSVPIKYHHPRNWREWKKQMLFDPLEKKVYAFYSKDGHHYVKWINHRNGKEMLTYKLKHHSAERMKIRDGYIYYVYRPFDSTQERFLYRERIE